MIGADIVRSIQEAPDAPMTYMGREVIHTAPAFCKSCGAPAEDHVCSYCGTPSEYVRVSYGQAVVMPEMACSIVSKR